MMKITKDRLKKIIKLEQKKYRLEDKQYLIFGKHLLEEYAKIEEKLEIILVSSEEEYRQYETFAKEIFLLSKNDFERFKSLKSTPSVIGICKMENMEDTDFIEESNILALNKVSNPDNLGAILRSAKAFGINNIYLDYGSADLYNPKTIQASQGALFSLQIRIGNLFSFCNKSLKENNYELITTFLDEPNTYSNSFENDKKKIVLVGNESLGIEDAFKDLQHENYKIDIVYESLNVVVATSIIMYEIMK